MEEQITAIWVGPTGNNSILGSVETNEEKQMSKTQFDYFKFLGLADAIKKVEKFKPEITDFKRESKKSKK